jgi:transposase-like protein
LSRGLRCTAGSHFICDRCINLWTIRKATLGLDPDAWGGVSCFGYQCSALFEEQALAMHCDPEAYAFYQQASRTQWVAVEKLRVAALDTANQEALRVRVLIFGEILTTSCPRCSMKVVVEVHGSVAQKCFSCGSKFCGFCLTLCGSSEDAHEHVAQCPLNTAFGNLEEARRLPRLRLLREYLGSMEEQQRDRVLQDCAAELAAEGYSVAEILAGDEQDTIEVERFETERRLAALSEADREADQEALRVHTRIVEILTLACPSCGKAFMFEGCFALCCEDEDGYGCGSGFCGFCLTLCEDVADAYQHVAQCLYSTNPGSVNGPLDNFEEAQRGRRLRLLREYLGPMEDQQRDRALQECEAELAALGCTVADLWADEQDPTTVLGALLRLETAAVLAATTRALDNRANTNRVCI